MKLAKLVDEFFAGKRSVEAINSYQAAILAEAKPLGYDSGGLTSKMWILPDGKPVSIGQMHFQWLKANPSIAERFGMDPAKLAQMEDEDEVRRYALQHGFVRVNFEHREGRITFEALAKHWTRQIKDAVFMLVAANLGAVWAMSVHLFNPGYDRIVRQGHVDLYRYDDRDKLAHLPLVSESRTRTREPNAP